MRLLKRKTAECREVLLSPQNREDAFSILRARLRILLPETGCKIVVVSSLLPQDGKTTVAVNLAISMAQTGARVLLADSGYGTDALPFFFGLEGQMGLRDTLSGKTAVTETVFSTDWEGLHFLPAGSVTSVSPLLADKGYRDIFSFLSVHYDYILVDAPSVSQLPEILPLVLLSAGVILVARQGVTTHAQLKKATDTLSLTQAKLLGVVLNDTKE